MHVDHACREVAGFILTRPSVVEERNDPAGNRTYSVRVLRAIPDRFGLLIGDALQAMRSSLDNTAWRLAQLHTAAPSDRVRFHRPHKAALVDVIQRQSS